MVQQIRFIQRNFSTSLKSLNKTLEKDAYSTIPEKLRDFEDRVNSFLEDGWRLHSIIQEQINNAFVPIVVLVRDN